MKHKKQPKDYSTGMQLDWIGNRYFNIGTVALLLASVILIMMVITIGRLVADLYHSKYDDRFKSDIVCNIYDFPGWTPLSLTKRNSIAMQVGLGNAEIITADTIDCLEKNPLLPNFNQIVRSERAEWYRLIPKIHNERKSTRKKRSRRDHD